MTRIDKALRRKAQRQRAPEPTTLWQMDGLEEEPLTPVEKQEERTMGGWKTYTAGAIFFAIAAWNGFAMNDWNAAAELFAIGLGIIGGGHKLAKIEAKIGQ